MKTEQPTNVNLLFALTLGAAFFFGYLSYTKQQELTNTQRRLEIEQTRLEQTELMIDKLRNFR